MNITPENVGSIIGDEFKCQAFRNAVKVDIARMANRNARGLTDDQKVDLLVGAREALKSAGFSNVSIRLTYKDRNGNWQNWPCVWVNPAQVDNAEASNRIDRLEKLVATLVSHVTEASTETEEADEDGDAVIVDDETKEENPL